MLDAEGKPLCVRDALALINQTLDEALAEQEGDFDADTRWALAWFEQSGFADGEYGVAETLSKAKNTSVQGLVDAGILKSSRGKVRLLAPKELSSTWDPATDPRLTAWEVVHHLIRALEAGGESAAASLVAKLGVKAEIARELAYRLYTLCERKKRAADVLAYNGLVQSFPEIVRLARHGGHADNGAALCRHRGVVVTRRDEVPLERLPESSMGLYYRYENGDFAARRGVPRCGAIREADAEVAKPALCRGAVRVSRAPCPG